MYENQPEVERRKRNLVNKKEKLNTLRKKTIENDDTEMKRISILEKQLYERKQLCSPDDWEIITILEEKENMIAEFKSKRQEFLYSFDEYINNSLEDLDRRIESY